MRKYTDLGKLISEEIINDPGTAIYANRFKMPTKGSWDTLKQLVSKNYITKIIIIISRKEVEGITAEDSKYVWDSFLSADPEPKISVQIASSESPIKDAYGIIAKNPKETYYFVYNPNEKDDPDTLKSLQKSFGKRVYGLPFDDKESGVSAPKLRDALEAGDYDGFVSMMPDAVVNKGYASKIFKKVAPKVEPKVEPQSEKLDEAEFPIPLSYQDKLKEFSEWVAEALDLQNIPPIDYIMDAEWSQKEKSFGGYVPSEKRIHLVVRNRNIMDSCRTLCHEMVHARQDEQGRLTSIKDGETGSEIESEANSIAGILMRNWGKVKPEWYDYFVSGN